MECSVVGVQRVFMEGFDIHGYNLFVTREQDGVEGLAVDILFLSDPVICRTAEKRIPSLGDSMVYSCVHFGLFDNFVDFYSLEPF